MDHRRDRRLPRYRGGRPSRRAGQRQRSFVGESRGGTFGRAQGKPASEGRRSHSTRSFEVDRVRDQIALFTVSLMGVVGLPISFESTRSSLNRSFFEAPASHWAIACANSSGTPADASTFAYSPSGKLLYGISFPVCLDTSAASSFSVYDVSPASSYTFPTCPSSDSTTAAASA